MKHPRIHITGASGSGTTTLGRALAARLRVPHLDTDEFYWLATDPPFTTKRPIDQRLARLREAQSDQGWVLSGSCMGWGEPALSKVDLIIYLSCPTPIRLERLKEREAQRFGSRIKPGGDMHNIHLAFMNWAASYDDPDFNGRSRSRHEAWLARLSVPVLRFDGDTPVVKLLERVLDVSQRV